jgi:hypothetical protein
LCNLCMYKQYSLCYCWFWFNYCPKFCGVFRRHFSYESAIKTIKVRWIDLSKFTNDPYTAIIFIIADTVCLESTGTLRLIAVQRAAIISYRTWTTWWNDGYMFCWKSLWTVSPVYASEKETVNWREENNFYQRHSLPHHP